jgi:hypothetical protein
MNGMDRGQLGQQQGMGARQLGQRMGSQQLGNGMGHQRSMNGMGYQVISLKTGSMRRMGKDTVSYPPVTNKTGFDPRQHTPQKVNASSPPIPFHYPPQDPHGTPRTHTASTGSIRPLPRQQPPQTPPGGSKTRNGPDRSSTTTLHTNDGSNGSIASSMQLKFVGRRLPLKSMGSQVQAQALMRPTSPQKPGRPTTPSTHKTYSSDSEIREAYHATRCSA